MTLVFELQLVTKFQEELPDLGH